MAKTTKKTTRINKKNKLHLKKSARWTIAGLMLATAVIIALIPVQNGGVSAKSSDTVPSIDTLCDNTQHGTVDKRVADPQSGALTPSYAYAFPIETGGEKVLNINNGSEIYRLIEMDGMPEGLPIPIFKLANSGTAYNYLAQYTGSGDNVYKPPGDTVDLGANVCVNKSSRRFGTDDGTGKCETINTVDQAFVDGTKPGTYQKIIEELATHHDTKLNIDYEYFHVVIEEWECFGEVSGEPAEFHKDPLSPRKLSSSEYYGVKDSSTTAADAEQNVAHICDKAFYNCGDIKSVILPNNITEIGESAFEA